MKASIYSPGTYQFRAPESSPVGSTIGRIKANDADEGVNAETEYKIIDGDEHNMFEIITDKETQEGAVIVKKVT